jgi:DNA-binding CsgD family transcriptional regulator
VWAELAARFADPGDDNLTAVRALPTLAGALRRAGRADDAAAAAEQGAAMASRLGTPHARAESLDELARLALTADDLARAEELHHEALAIRRDRHLLTHLADSLDGLARVAAKREEHVEAARLLAASDRARAESGYPRPLVDTEPHAQLEAALRRAIGEAAHGEARREGADLQLHDAITYLTRPRGQRGRPSGQRGRPATGWDSLTPAELQVVALVAEGLTNPQIAQRLFVSRATVKTHLSHVFTRLGLASRAELAALATQHRQLDSRP